MKPIIIIPALNPEKNLLDLIQKLRKKDIEILLVDDGSSKEHKNIFKILKNQYGCHVITHEKNLGKGAALKTGISFCSINFPDSSGYITADADGQHLFEDILKVYKALENNPHSLVLGCRDFNKNDVPFKSKWGNKITSFIYLCSIGKRCNDTQTGLRGIPMEYTDSALSIPGDRFQYEMNLLLEFGKRNINFVSIPISTIYLEKNKSSHFNPVLDSIMIYLNIVKYSFSSLSSAAIDLFVFTLLINTVFFRNSIGILASTVIARLMSGFVNFSLNKYWVFKSKNQSKVEVFKYTVLFSSQMFLSWFLVSALNHIGNITLIKVIVDTSLFFFSYHIQKKFIFHNRKDAVQNEVFVKTL